MMSNSRIQTVAPPAFGTETEQSAAYSRFGQLENQICELSYMAAIMDEVLDHVFEFAPPQGSMQTFELNRDEIEKCAFAYKNVLERVNKLKRGYYAAWDGVAG